MYPNTVYEIQAAVIGNASTGFFQYAHNRLLDDGDSLWITWGTTSQSGPVREGVARPGTTGSHVVAQSQLRKGPTWVLIQDTSTDLSAAGIVVGSDKIRVYPDPIGTPALYIERVIRNILQDADGYWYVEVAHDTPLFDNTTTPVVPPTGATLKLTRPSSGHEYKIVDTTGVTTRVTQRSFANYASNLWWHKAGRVDPLMPSSGAEWRENEWEYAFPLCVVSGDKLFFPAASAGGIAESSTLSQSPAGFVRTSQTDNVYASHLWNVEQFFKGTPGNALVSLITTSNPLSPGAGYQSARIEEAHTDGNASSPVYWTGPNRPARFGLMGNANARGVDFFRVAEQGFCTSGLAEKFDESSLQLRESPTISTPATHGTGFRTLTASQMSYVMRADRITSTRYVTTFPVTTTNLDTIKPAPHGLEVTTSTPIQVALAGTYEAQRSKHDFIIEGWLSFNDIFPWATIVNGSVTGFPSGPNGDVENYQHTLSLPFFAKIRLTPDAVATNPMAVAVLGRSPRIHKRTKIRWGNAISGGTFSNDYYVPQDVIEAPSAEALAANFGDGTNDKYPTVHPGGDAVIFDAVFTTDMMIGDGSGGGTTTVYDRYSQVKVEIVAVPNYNSTPPAKQEITFYARFEFRIHNDEADASQNARQNKHAFVKTWKALLANAGFLPQIAPTFYADLMCTHVPVWA